MASKDREQRAGRTGTQDRRHLDAAARKRGGKPVGEGLGGVTKGGYAEPAPKAKRSPP